jgi:RNA polymerase sigma factor (sigma-70 family)
MRTVNEDLLPTRWTLIERLKNWDDQRSWRQFFDTYWKLVYGVARRAGLSPEDAQDVVQETVVSVCKAMPNFQADPGRGSFKSWLLTITRHRIIDLQRRRRKEVALAGPASVATAGATRAEDRVVDPAGNGFDELWEAEWERNTLALALEKLGRKASARHFQIFLLHVIKQHPAEQVAKVANVDTNQVYLVKHRLTPLFREAVAEVEARTA